MKATNAKDVPGLLFVWTQIDAEFEDDFNRWYDREHIEERIRIPGLSSGTRYRAIDTPRGYLGLYRTDSIEVFDSAPYQSAFRSQTPWSIKNFGRMRDPMRRVFRVVSETGFGTGASLAVLRFGNTSISEEAARAAGIQVQTMDGIVSTRLLVPDVEKSTPLPNERREGRIMDAILLIDATTEAAARTGAGAAAARLGLEDAGKPVILAMMWQARADDLGRTGRLDT